ncbi:hypothetical protein QP568_03645 [Propionimicrobium lymphophilum]|uniref:hypothetical protein n=1 Tax=Propionimicrobium lymphophilum TaxID=33012 RepID=UPI00254F2E56|nr:hypothetical protein [Propionimicrobium lymphophilum]MDK7709403.1 hypothetical protein [Propionimicrobium lymphophilum]MDK7733390.1 hypothetical protein [Propionimicrobium lymphophilum]
MNEQLTSVTLELKTRTIISEVACAIRKHAEYVASIAGDDCPLAGVLSAIAEDLKGKAQEMEAELREPAEEEQC